MKKFLVTMIIILMLALGFVAYLTNEVSNAVVEVHSTPSQNTTLKVVPNYGTQETAPGSLLQPATVCLQNCNN